MLSFATEKKQRERERKKERREIKKEREKREKERKREERERKKEREKREKERKREEREREKIEVTLRVTLRWKEVQLNKCSRNFFFALRLSLSLFRLVV